MNNSVTSETALKYTFIMNIKYNETISMQYWIHYNEVLTVQMY